MTIDYALIWAGLIAFAVLAYIVLDGFDLGVGILFPWVKGQAHRDQMMNSVVPVWDGNETWLVLGGGRLIRSVSTRLRDHHAGLICPVYCDATGLGVQRCGV